MMTNVQLALFIARSRAVRVAAMLVIVVSALAMAAIMTTRMMQLSGETLAATQVGSADYAVQLPIDAQLPFTDDADARRVVAAAAEAGARGARVGYVTGFAQIDGTGQRVVLSQHDWASDPFPQGDVLQDGRMPSAVGEAAVAAVLAHGAPIGSEISLFGGALSLKVVGVFENQGSRFGEFLALADGTLEQLSARSPAELDRYQIAFSPILYWTGSRPDQVVGAVATALDLPREEVGALHASLVSRDETAARPPTALAELDLVGVLVPAVATVVGAWLITRLVYRLRAVLIQLGVTRTVLSLQGTAVVVLALAAVMGGFAGIGTALVARPVIAALSPNALSAATDVFETLGRLSLTVAVTATLAIALSGFGSRSRARAAEERPVRMWVPLVAGMATIGVGVALMTSNDVNLQILAIVLIGAGCCFAAPLALTRFSGAGGDATAWTLARRRATGGRRASNGAILALSVLLMVGAVIATLYQSDAATQQAQRFENVPPGQAYFESPAVDEDLLSEIRDYLGAEAPARFAHATASPLDVEGGALVAPTLTEVERLIDRALNDEERDVLNDGGALLTRASSTSVLRLDVQGRIVTLPAIFADDLPNSMQARSAILLGATAEANGIPLVRHTWVFTDLSSEQVTKAEQAPSQLGFEPDWLEAHRLPDPFTIQDELLLLLAAIVVAGVCVISAYAAGTARAMRPRLSGLAALGLPRGWLARAVAGEVGIVVVISIVVALLASMLAAAVGIAVGSLPLQLSVPVYPLALLVVVLLVATVIAVAASTSRLRSTERYDRW